MWRVLGFLALVGLVVTVFKLAIILLVVAGLIFRTKETVGLLLLLAVMAGFAAHPLIGTGLGLVLLAICLYYKKKEKGKEVESAVTALPAPDD